MQKEKVTLTQKHIIGISVRTNNRHEFNPLTQKIGPLVERFVTDNLAQQIPNRKNPGVMIDGMTEYESDEYGDYTYFIGEEVTSLDPIPQGMQGFSVPDGAYLKFTTKKGPLPDVIIDVWQAIWAMRKDNTLGAERAYRVDFEVYDERAKDPANAVVDIYIGIHD